jgi:lipid-binding SYLF domain-containing protein
MHIKTTLMIAAATATLAACSSNDQTAANTMTADNGSAMTTTDASSTVSTDDQSDTQNLVSEATAEVQKMKADPQLAKLLQKAEGVYIVPEFGRGALIVGGKGGAGVVMTKQNGAWTSSPAFYDFGSLSIGAQAGGSGGRIAFLLMTDNAVNAFMSGNKVSLNADSDLSIVNYSANAEASWGKGDIILWSDTSGAYAGATISVGDLNWDDGNNQAYYGSKVEPRQVLTGKVTNPKAAPLQQALS